MLRSIRSVSIFALILPAVAMAAKPVSCTVVGTAGFTQLGTLNNNSYAGFGTSLDTRLTTIGGQPVVMAAMGGHVTSDLSSPGQVNVFFLDPGDGTILDGGPLGQPHLTMNLTERVSMGDLVIADLDANGALDILIGGRNNAGAWVFLGQLDGGGTLSYPGAATELPAGEAVDGYGWSIAVSAPVSGYPMIAVGAPALLNGSSTPGRVILFQYNGSSFVKQLTIVDPQNAVANHFGTGVAFGDIDAITGVDLAVGAMDASGTVSRTAGAGRVYVYSGSVAGSPAILTANVKGEGLGQRTKVGNLDANAFPDLLAVGKARALIYPGAVGAPSATTLLPLAGSMANGFGLASDIGDVDGDGIGDPIIGAYLAGSGSNCQTGAAYVYLSGSGFARSTLQPTGVGQFGHRVAAVDGTRLLLIQAHVNLDVFVYKVN